MNHLLESYTGDGLLIATSFGSTAHNKSIGGSLVDNDLNTLQITPMAPINSEKYHTLTNPFLISQNKEISLFPGEDSSNIIELNGLNSKLIIIEK